MSQRLSFSQLSILIALTLGIAALVVLVIYILHKTLGKHRAGMQFEAKSPKVENEPAFAAATVQGVITDLKAREKVLTELCQRAQERATFSQKALDRLAWQLPYALLIFDREGFLVLANPAAREILKIDIWSKRRFSDLLAHHSHLASLIGGAFEAERGPTHRTVQWSSREDARPWQADVTVIEDLAGGVGGLICVVKPSESIRPPQQDGV